MRSIKKYEPIENQTLRCSNRLYNLISYMYNNGHHRSIKLHEALYIHQSTFGSAGARGLIANDGVIWYLTELGVDWYRNFTMQPIWKEYASREFSVYLKVIRAIKKPPARETAKAKAVAV